MLAADPLQKGEIVSQINETVVPARAGKATAICLSMSFALVFPGVAAADAVTDWNVKAAKAALAACIEVPGSNDPGNESRMYAMMHVAIHDALNAIDRRFHPYVFNGQGPTGASREAAVASAARNVLEPVISHFPFSKKCMEDGIASVEADYLAAIAALPNNAATMQGIEVGKSSAAAIVALRAKDGSDVSQVDDKYPQGTEPGEFRFVPGFDFAFGEAWGHVTPFVLKYASQFRPRPPYHIRRKNYAADFNEVKPIRSKKYAADLNEVKAFGGDDVTSPSLRTQDQTQLGLFWIEGSVLTWNRIARTVSDKQGLDLWENARLFGLLNLALADAYIAHFDAKYHYKLWRPVTAAHLADSDGNPHTKGDPTWVPLQQNYPTPSYPSGHSTAGGAASRVLQEFFGIDNIDFTVCSLTLPPGQRCTDPHPVYRSYLSFSQAAEENALSRILVGLHFRNDVDEGLKFGRRIGHRAANLFLGPVWCDFAETR
jgi:hypothetical protein